MRNIRVIHILSAAAAVLLFIITMSGVFSWDGSKTYDTVNQYGETVKMWGSGIYAHDSFFKATVHIGSDMCMLFVGVPLTVFSIVYDLKKQSRKSRLMLVSALAWLLYYAASLCFGIVYNALFLVYLALFLCTFYGFITGIYGVSKEHFAVPDILAGKACTVFLLLSGISTFIAWLPDIIESFGKGTLGLIEVYTTQITYVLDMGIISPTALICLYLLKKRKSFGTVLLSVLSTGIVIVGVMMIFQTAVQLISGVDLPLPAIITKSAIFTALGIYGAVLAGKLYKNI